MPRLLNGSDADPISQAVALSIAHETAAERRERLQTEKEASSRSAEIDRELEHTRKLKNNLGPGSLGLVPKSLSSRTNRVLLLLLLGPSNAGKTSVLLIATPA